MTKRKLKRKPKKLLICIIIIILLLLVTFLVYHFCFNKEKVKAAKVVSKIPEYGYTLKSNKSASYKKLFKQLKEVLSAEKVDEKEYVKTITKMFIIDFYSLNDHSAKTDIGGVDFVSEEALDNFLVNAEDTLYKYVESNIYKQRKQKLPEVSEVTINKVETTEYAYGDKNDENAYQVEAKWTYVDPKISNEYQDEATLIFVHNDKKLVLVELSELAE